MEVILTENEKMQDAMKEKSYLYAGGINLWDHLINPPDPPRPKRILTEAEYTERMEILEAYLYLKHEIETHDTTFVVLRCRGGMPPAAATHQIIGETDRLNELPHQTYHKYLFDDIPTPDGMIRLEEAKANLNNINAVRRRVGLARGGGAAAGGREQGAAH